MIQVQKHSKLPKKARVSTRKHSFQSFQEFMMSQQTQ